MLYEPTEVSVTTTVTDFFFSCKATVHIWKVKFLVGRWELLFLSNFQEQQDNYNLLLATLDVILDKLRHGKL